MNVQCKNLKIKLELKEGFNFEMLNTLEHELIKKKTSYIIKIPCSNSVITIYKHSLKNVHATGLTSQQTLNYVLNFVSLKLKNNIIDYKINNSMFVGKYGKAIDLYKIINEIESIYPMFNCSLVWEIFPALFIKPAGNLKKSGHPTILLFRNSSFVIIGSKSLKYIKSVANMLKSLIDK
jgi:hypothetical protein